MSTTIFYAPKTSGNTIIAINTALACQQLNPNKKYGLLQLSHYPDLHLFIGAKPTPSLDQILPFWGTKEWGKSIISKITQHANIDIILSPKDKWPDINSTELLPAFLTLLQDHYDEVFIDINIPETDQLFNLIMKSAGNIIISTLPDPASLESVKTFARRFPKLQKKSQLIVNQAAPTLTARLQSDLPLPLLGSLPSDNRRIWSQIYEGFPVVFQKRSKLKKAFINLAKTL